MTRQVMAALTDPSVKNKMQFISKICDGDDRKKRMASIPKRQADKDKDLLAHYLNPSNRNK